MSDVQIEIGKFMLNIMRCGHHNIIVLYITFSLDEMYNLVRVLDRLKNIRPKGGRYVRAGWKWVRKIVGELEIEENVLERDS